MRKHLVVVSAALVLMTVLCAAQTVSSSITGVLLDSTGAALPGVECNLTNQATGATYANRTGLDGGFTFPNLLAGRYTFSAQMTGFKTLETRDIIVTSGEVRALGSLSMQVGEVRESISVEAQAVAVQTSSSEKSGVVTGTQLNDIAVRGRDFFTYLQTIPGVVDNFSQRRETASPDAIRGTFINGGRENQKNFNVDGVTAMDTGSNSTIHFQPNMDAVSEVKVMTSNYQAEFGRNGSGVITVITKGGSRDYHGSAYWFYRHESMNANTFFNNRTGTGKAPYRYRINGYSIGGPVLMPGGFNKERDKLFFFWSQEYVGMKKDYGTRFVNMPTAMERAGNFSDSRDTNGALIPVKDPLTGTNFAGNIIPASRFNSLGLNMLKFFPLPNYTDPDPNLIYSRNYRSQYAGAYPKRQDMVRIDMNFWNSFQAYYRFIKDKDEQDTPYGMWVNGSLNYDLTPTRFGQPGKGHVIRTNKIFSPTVINEFTFGKSRNNLYFFPVDESLMTRDKMGNPKQWYEDSYIDKNYGPNIQFGGQPANPVYLSWGNQVGGGNFRGHFNFSRDTNNPFDSNHSYANALLGNFQSYSEANHRINGDWWFWNLEMFVQDNWRVSRKLTLDLGLRMYHLPPQTDKNRTIATFDPALYSRANAPALYMPARNAAGQRVSVNPITGQLAAPPLIGLFVPGSGNPANGAAVGGENGFPAGLYTTNALAFGPRVGFAYDVFGNGKTAIRGGFGMFKDRMQGNPTMNTNGNPPVAFNPTLFYGSLDTYAQSGGATGPTGISALLGHNKAASTFNFSIGIQQEIFGFAFDVSYVGGQSRHLLASRNINPIPMYGRFDLARFEDPTQPGRPLPDNFMRPYYGWGDINLRSANYNSNYNSFQLAVNRRYARGLQVGVAYTFSKTLGVADGDTSGVSPYFSPEDRNYGRLGFDRPHVFVANYIYDLPKVGSSLGFKPLKYVLDDWQISGMTTLQSGSPFTPGYSLVQSMEITGSSEGARINVLGNPNLPEERADLRPLVPHGRLRASGRARLRQRRRHLGLQTIPAVRRRTLLPVPRRVFQHLEPHPVFQPRHRRPLQPRRPAGEPQLWRLHGRS
jgi:hypothetical protein